MALKPTPLSLLEELHPFSCQPKTLGTFLLIPNAVYPIHKQILMVLLSEYYLEVGRFYHLHCYPSVPIPHLWPGLNSLICICPFTVSSHQIQDDTFKNVKSWALLLKTMNGSHSWVKPVFIGDHSALQHLPRHRPVLISSAFLRVPRLQPHWPLCSSTHTHGACFALSLCLGCSLLSSSFSQRGFCKSPRGVISK